MHPAITPKTQKLFRWIKAKKVPAILKKFACFREYLGNTICCSLEKETGCSVNVETLCAYLKGVKRPGNKKRAKGLLTSLIGRKLLKIERYFDRAVDIIPAGVSKGTAARFLMKQEGWNPTWCIAVGDSEFDIPLFRNVGRIGCPSNATPGCIAFVKQNRGKVSMRPYTEGVLDVINWYLGAQETG
jgi:hypothetical protein